ncbi:MAG: AAA family ATPase [Desulfobacterales bacterium]
MTKNESTENGFFMTTPGNKTDAATMDLFEHQAEKATARSRPLADRMRPAVLDDFIGQEQAVGKDSLIRSAIFRGPDLSMILWGPPGCGKTTWPASLRGRQNAISPIFPPCLRGKRHPNVIDTAKQQRTLHRNRTLLFVGEIHRFNKAQQDAFLHHVESGLITLIGATTENPSFEVIPGPAFPVPGHHPHLHAGKPHENAAPAGPG